MADFTLFRYTRKDGLCFKFESSFQIFGKENNGSFFNVSLSGPVCTSAGRGKETREFE